MKNYTGVVKLLKEKSLLDTKVCGFRCEVVEAGGAILLYVDGHFEGELYEEETVEGYISQIREILE